MGVRRGAAGAAPGAGRAAGGRACRCRGGAQGAGLFGDSDWRVDGRADEEVLAREGIGNIREAETKDRRVEGAATRWGLRPVCTGGSPRCGIPGSRLRGSRLRGFDRGGCGTGLLRSGPITWAFSQTRLVCRQPPVTGAGRAEHVGSQRAAWIEMRRLRGRVFPLITSIATISSPSGVSAGQTGQRRPSNRRAVVVAPFRSIRRTARFP